MIGPDNVRFLSKVPTSGLSRNHPRFAVRSRRGRYPERTGNFPLRWASFSGIVAQRRLAFHHFLDGAADVPFADGFDAFCFGGPAFFGFRISLLPFAISAFFICVRSVSNGRQRQLLPTAMGKNSRLLALRGRRPLSEIGLTIRGSSPH